MQHKNIIINVGRQLGAGGHAIAKLLAEEFNCMSSIVSSTTRRF